MLGRLDEGDGETEREIVEQVGVRVVDGGGAGVWVCRVWPVGAEDAKPYCFADRNTLFHANDDGDPYPHAEPRAHEHRYGELFGDCHGDPYDYGNRFPHREHDADSHAHKFAVGDSHADVFRIADGVCDADRDALAVANFYPHPQLSARDRSGERVSNLSRLPDCAPGEGGGPRHVAAELFEP